MKKIKSYKSKNIITVSALAVAALLSGHSSSFAEDKTLPSLVISATRYETPQSQVSNDITVITAEDISHMPVHEVSEALDYITGVTFFRTAGPGSNTDLMIQGSGNPAFSNNTHIKIVIDDIPLETLSVGSYDLSQISLQHVERIEVIKGSASSVWGGALGGVINIVTRKPTDKPTAEAGLSVGERSTYNYNAAVSGKVGGTGYFLSGSRLETDGFYKHQKLENNNTFIKLTQDITRSLSAEMSYSHFNNQLGYGEFPDFGFYSDGAVVDDYGSLKLRYSPDKDSELSLTAYNRYYFTNVEWKDLVTRQLWFPAYEDREHSIGIVLKGGWKHSEGGYFSVGAEGSNSSTEMNTYPTKYDEYRRAIYINESFTIDNLTLNAGVRYDDDYLFGTETSPSAGLVYNLNDKATLFRLNVARGFSPPPLIWRYSNSPTLRGNPDLTAERAWTYNAGIETRYIPGLWSKVNIYRADITDALDSVIVDSVVLGSEWDVTMMRNIGKFSRQGVEIDLKTDEYNGLSMSYGYAFCEIKNDDTGEIIKNKPRTTHNIGIDYRGPFETRTTIKGRYVYWNGVSGNIFDSGVTNPQDQNFLWDAKISKYMTKWKKVVGEVYVSLHNVTDIRQYQMEFYPNPGRWVEVGLNLSTF